jgi:stage II sporulation protein GA (sporulation sigma-E factor processing peptidase)
MMAIKPDKVVIVSRQGQIETSKVLVGLRSGRLSSDGAYQAIIHPHLLEHGFGT